MTLSIAIAGARTIWLCTDTRLSYQDHSRDGGIKCLQIQESTDTAYVGYCGLGATEQGTEPSAWMARVLRGGSARGIEPALAQLAQAATEQLPSHLLDIGNHAFHAAAMVRGEPRLYYFDITVRHEGNYIMSQPLSRISQAKLKKPAWQGVRMHAIGTGATWMSRHSKESVMRLKRLIRDYEQGRFENPFPIMRMLRAIVKAVGSSDSTVSRDCRILGLDPVRGTTAHNNLEIPVVSNGWVASQLSDLMSTVKDGETLTMKGEEARDFFSRPEWRPDQSLD